MSLSFPYFLTVRNVFNAVVVLGTFSLPACGGSTIGAGSVDEVPSLEFAAASSAGQSLSLTIDLTGAQVLPASDTRETGRASFILNTESRQLDGVLNTTVDDYISVHLHEGDVGEVGADIVSLYRKADGSFVVPDSTYLTPSQVDLFSTGKLYMDIHTDTFEIRGQLSTDIIQSQVGATLSELQSQVFTPVCSGCHTGGGLTLPGIMDFSSEQATYSSLVGVNSLSVDGLLRVEPFEPDQSFLLDKLKGIQSVGSRMPLRGISLNDQVIQSISQWIALGALR